MGGVNRLAPVNPADAEGLDRGIRVHCKVLDRYARGVGPEHALLGLLLLPDPTPAGRRRIPTGDVHGLHFLVSLWKREGLFEVEGVLHLAGRVVLRLEEGVEIPVALLDNVTVEFLKTHLEEDLPHLGNDPLVGVDLARVHLLRELGYVIPAEVSGLPAAREDLFAGKCAGLFAEVETFCGNRETFRSDGNDVPHGLAFLQDPTLDKFFSVRFTCLGISQCGFLSAC